MLKVVGSEAAGDEVDARSVLDEIAREGARRAHRDERDAEGHALVVRNGRGSTRRVTVGSGTIPVSAPRVNDRRTDPDGERRRFTSRILPPYMRRSPKVAEVLPVLHRVSRPDYGAIACGANGGGRRDGRRGGDFAPGRVLIAG